MARFGGKDGRATGRTIAHLVEDLVYVAYSWRGTVTKAKFSAQTEFLNIILGAIRMKHKKYDDLTKFFQDHLKQSSVRLNRKTTV